MTSGSALESLLVGLIVTAAVIGVLRSWLRPFLKRRALPSPATGSACATTSSKPKTCGSCNGCSGL